MRVDLNPHRAQDLLRPEEDESTQCEKCTPCRLLAMAGLVKNGCCIL
jgi:hypothetical protein